MTVINTDNSVRENGNGAKTAFDYSFKMFETDEFAVFKIDTSVTPEVSTPQVLGVDYTATINTLTEGGTITYTVAPAATEDSFISRLMDLDQPTDIPREANFPEEAIENEFDRSRMIDIQQQADIDLKIGFAATSSTTGVTFPEPVANKAILWNAAGDDLINSTDDFNDIVTDAAASAAAAAASASSAATSASNAATSETNAATSAANAALEVGYAAEWANKAEDSLVSAAAGGDLIDDYSALHWANKAAASAAASTNVISVNQATHGFSADDWIYHNGTQYALADASVIATAEAIGVVTSVTDVDNFIIQFSGRIVGLSGLTAGALHYISETSGQITNIAPTTNGTVVKPVLIADSTTTGFIFNQKSAVNGVLVASDLNLTGQAAEDYAIFDGTNWVAQGQRELRKVGTFTRDMATASGTQAVTGILFKPSAIILFAGPFTGPGNHFASWGAADNGISESFLFSNRSGVADDYGEAAGDAISIEHSSGNQYRGDVQSYDAAGFTINWTRTGVPTGTISIGYIAFR